MCARCFEKMPQADLAKHWTEAHEFKGTYQEAIDNLLDLIEDMKESGDYHDETLAEIVWRMT